MTPKLSIIIPTLNRGKNLRQVLDSVIMLHMDKITFELLIIDNASIDDTKTICRNFIDNNKDLTIRYFYEPVPGLLSGRHLGAKHAQGEILGFLDDDVELTPNWAKDVIEIMEKRKDIDLLTGPNLPKYETYPPKWLNFFWKSTPYGGTSCGELSLLDLGHQVVEIDATWVWGLNFIIRKSVYEKLKGFHPDSVPQNVQFLQGDGETGLSIKANEVKIKSLYHYKVMLYHFVPTSRLTKNYFEKRYYYQGISDSYTKLRAEYGLYQKSDNNEMIDSFAKKVKRFIKQQFSIISKLNNKKKLPKVIIQLKFDLHKKYLDGYAFHQSHFNSNPIVKKWVLKSNYMDYKLPKF
jgi:glycosyltransferase involved in cell wall biosynthesis